MPESTESPTTREIYKPYIFPLIYSNARNMAFCGSVRHVRRCESEADRMEVARIALRICPLNFPARTVPAPKTLEAEFIGFAFAMFAPLYIAS